MFFLEMFQYEFMTRAFLAGVLVAVIAPMIGMFLVVRRYSFMADTLAHVALAGVAAGLLTGVQPILTALAASLLTAVSVESLRFGKKLLGETALSIFLSGGLAISSILLSLGGTGANLHGILFGSIATVTRADLLLISALGLLVTLSVILLYKEFFAIAHDEDLAIASGLPVRFLNLLLVCLAAVTVALTMRVVGVLLVGALMVIPVASAMQLKCSFRRTLALAVAFSLFSVVTGLTASFYLGLASGGTIVLTALAVFVACALLGKR